MSEIPILLERLFPPSAVDIRPKVGSLINAKSPVLIFSDPLGIKTTSSSDYLRNISRWIRSASTSGPSCSQDPVSLLLSPEIYPSFCVLKHPR